MGSAEKVGKICHLNDPKMRRVAKACEHPAHTGAFPIPKFVQQHYLVTTFKVGRKQIHVVQGKNATSKTQGLLPKKEFVDFIVYRGKAYGIHNRIAQILFRAIEENVSPNLCALLEKERK